MTNLPCELPDSKESKQVLSAYMPGKMSAQFSVCFFVWFVAAAHALVDISYYWTLLVFGVLLVYSLIPEAWYMRNVYRFFIGSFIGSLAIPLIFYYTGLLFLRQIEIDTGLSWLLAFAAMYFFVVIGIEWQHLRKNVPKLKKCLNLSIHRDEETGVQKMYIDEWTRQVEKVAPRLFESKSMWIGVWLALPVVVFFGWGGGLVSAKILLNNGYDTLFVSVLSFVCLVLGIIFLFVPINDFCRVVAVFQLKDEEIL